MIVFDYDLDQIIKKAKYWCENIFETKEVTPVHILYSIIKDEANIIYNIFWEMGVAMELLTEDLKKLAKANKQKLKTDKIYTSKSLENVLEYSLQQKKENDKRLTLTDVMLGIFDVKNECSDILKIYDINKKDFFKVHSSYLSYENGFIMMGQVINSSNIETVEGGKNENINIKPNAKEDILDRYCRNISDIAKRGKLNEIYGRDKEIAMCIEILNKTKKKNILLIGEAGVGKTSIVEGLAYKLADKKIYELDLNKLVAGTKFRGDLENRINKLLERIKEKNDIVLFIDEAHSLKNAGNSDDGLSLINVLKPPMARGEIQLILATTNKDYTLYLEDDKALERRCTILHVNEPDKKTTLHILREFAKKNEITISDQLLNNIYNFSKKNILNKMMPDKALDILDICYAKEKINRDLTGITRLQNDLDTLNKVKAELFSEGNRELSKQIYTREKELKSLLLKEQKKIEISEEVFNLYVKENYNVPETSDFTFEMYEKDAEWFKKNITGQDEVLNLLIKSYYGYNLKVNNKPFNYFFMGNSGMGKTNTVELFAEKYFNSNIFIINCSEYKEAHSISNLIGSPAGYVRSNEGGTLVNYVDKNPRSVILFDEIEEAHEDVYGLLLQILDKGVLIDRKNLIANFINCAIFFTSNIGVKEMASSIGFNTKATLDKTFLEGMLSKKFEKKFLNRINNIGYFNNLNETDYMHLLNEKIKELRKSFKERISIRVNKDIKNSIISECTSNNLGVRQLYKIIDDKIYNAVLMEMLNGKKKITL